MQVFIYECEKNNSKELEGRPGATEHWTNFKLENISVPRGILAADCTCPICKEGQILLDKQGLETKKWRNQK